MFDNNSDLFKTISDDRLSQISGGKGGLGWLPLVDPIYNLARGLYDGWKAKHK
ncbi:lactococcin G-beta/enterocin 1071B family bacteriocin [Streptococcus hyovaginalis]